MFIPVAGYLYYRHRVDSTSHSKQKSSSSGGSVTLILFFLFSLWAAYLSWSCNTTNLIGIGWKILYSFGAFIQGIFYILNYYLFKMNTKTCCGK